MKIKSQKDFWSGLMFIVVGVGFAIGATNYTMGASARPGPGYFPLGLGVLLAILGAAIVLEALSVDTPDGEPIGSFAWKPLVTIVGSVALFGFTLPHLGLVVALPLLVILSSLAGDEFHWGEAILNSIVLTLGSWAVFVWGLSLTIPLWPSFLAR